MLERGVRGGRRAVQCASRAGRGAAHQHEGGEVDTMSLSLQRRRNKEVPTAVPPRGVEPRTLPTNRTTGRHRPTGKIAPQSRERATWAADASGEKSKERGCAGCAQKCGARVGAITGAMRSPGLTPGPASPTLELTRPARCTCGGPRMGRSGSGQIFGRSLANQRLQRMDMEGGCVGQ